MGLNVCGGRNIFCYLFPDESGRITMGRKMSSPRFGYVLATRTDAASAAAKFRLIVEFNHLDLASLFPQLHFCTSFLLLEYLSSHCYPINKPNTYSGRSFFRTQRHDFVWFQKHSVKTAQNTTADRCIIGILKMIFASRWFDMPVDLQTKKNILFCHTTYPFRPHPPACLPKFGFTTSY